VHFVSSVGVVAQTQTPPVQVALAGQALPHTPQLRLSVCVLVHVLPQTVLGAAQTHVPAEHVFPFVHAFPHAPQLLESVSMSVRHGTSEPLHVA
jgi:hypothetical protein